MDVNLERTCCVYLQLRTGCFVIGWYDIIYGHAMVLVYLVLMYTGYFNTSGIYYLALWLDFIFTITQLLKGAVLVYGIKYKTVGLVLLSAVVGVVMTLADVVGDVMLVISFPDATLLEQVLAVPAFLTSIGIRGYMTFCVYRYYQQLKDEVYLRLKLHNTIPDIINFTSGQ